ncbi:MAG: hypothetical protein U5K37_10940 [Natrialbaceae archaeon]|nr:hypothetical protein [Natrialbaceae archaeon]
MSDRERSFWGWGYADHFPDEDRRQALADRLEQELGFPERPLLEPPAIGDVTLPSPVRSVPGHLGDWITADREARIRHTYGRAYRDIVRGFHGSFEPAPGSGGPPTDRDRPPGTARVGQ